MAGPLVRSPPPPPPPRHGHWEQNFFFAASLNHEGIHKPGQYVYNNPKITLLFHGVENTVCNF